MASSQWQSPERPAAHDQAVSQSSTGASASGSATTNASAQSESSASGPAAINLYPQPLSPSPDESSSQPEPVLLFEVAWEVCWQLGGIYTVLRTKAAAMLDRWGDRYCLIGPYNPQTAAVEFEELPTEGLIRDTLDRLRSAGVPCHHGRWLISGRPRVILLDYRARFGSLDVDKYLLWKDHGIDTLGCDAEVNEVVAFGYVVAEFFRELCDLLRGRRAVLAHFHEWMGGVAVPRIAHMQLPVATVFTTHATLLGRYLASDNPYFYQHLPFINADQEAVKYNILSKHQIEKTAAHACTVFTTVSEVTAFEAEKLLGRKPDAILPNGLNIQRFAALHEFQNLHRQYKEKIHEFVMGHFFPAYAFDLEHTLYVFTSGRYEYRNKGLDMFIEAMYRLNQVLRGVPDRPTIVSFIITRAPTRNINVGVLQSQAMFDELRATCADIEHEMGRRLFLAATTGRLPGMNELLADDAVVRLKRAMHVWRSGRQPSIVTHDLVDDANDAVLKHLRWRQLFNAADDPVKVVFHPEFLTATSPLISLDYNDFVRGCHLGIFPSYYEPWGYTPMESIARGVPAVTTDLSGFGAYVQRHIEDARSQGIMVLNRRNRSFDDAVGDLVQYLLEFIQLNRRQRIELRNRTERLGELFDWSVLVSHYHEAHDLALERRGGLRPGTFELRIV
ncbi:glycosyltransferase [Fontivita pretiosa]|uniref:glycosyltransferase n=1 Tax=Fontivita pretiosa TaxID=2989684 RepID=UPI003D177950